MLRKKTTGVDSSTSIGFGSRISATREKFIREDGNFNIRKTGLPFWKSFNLYHYLITISWTKFFLWVFLLFVTVNLFFASLYMLIGPEQLSIYSTGIPFANMFAEAFFFSAQTLSTVGYGRIAPVGILSSTIAAVEAMLGLLMFALATGVLYGRFSRPKIYLVKSKNAIIAPFKRGAALMFRIANSKNNQLVEPEVSVLVAMQVEENGQSVRRFFDLELELKKVTFLALSWTLVHPIDEKSPLYGINSEQLAEADAEIIILFKAFDDTFSQSVQSRFSYKFDEIIWGRKFTTIFKLDEDGINSVDLSALDMHEAVELPILSQTEAR